MYHLILTPGDNCQERNDKLSTPDSAWRKKSVHHFSWMFKK